MTSVELRPPRPLRLYTKGFTVIGYRISRLSVVACADELVVRNYFRTRRLRPEEIEDFRIGDPYAGLPFGKTVYVLLRDGTILPLDAGAGPYTLRRERATLETNVQALRDWLTDRQR